MELRQLQTFQAVVRCGTLLRAAEQLQYAQSTVTLHIQQLEQALGVELFARRGKRLALTEAGRALCAHAEDVLGRVEALRQAMTDFGAGTAGHLRIGAIEPAASLRLPALLVRFCADRPKVRLTIEPGGTQSVCDRVAEGDLDAGITSPPPAHLDLTFEPLYQEPLALLAPAGHPLAAFASVHIRDLAGHRLLLTERVCAYRAEIERVLTACGANLDSGIEIGSLGALRRAVQAGLGPAIVPSAIATPPPDGTVLREVEGATLALPVGIVRRPDAPIGRALGAFLDLVRGEKAG
jgi:LysR family transcriptional regulator, regulator of the ytmI operon